MTEVKKRGRPKKTPDVKPQEPKVNLDVMSPKQKRMYELQMRLGGA